MKTNLFAHLLVLLCVSACSTHWRTGDPGVDYPTMISQLDNLLGTNGESVTTSTGSTSEMAVLRQDPNSSIYFAQAPGSLGSVAAVAKLDLGWLGVTGMDFATIKSIQIYFIDGTGSKGHEAGLMVSVAGEGSSTDVHVFTSASAPRVTGGIYSVTVSDGTNSLVLSSKDVAKNGKLATVIQLTVGDAKGNPVGKFTTLVGFLP
jgi:hypothetical protein